VAAEMLRYYETVGRVVTAANIQWIPVVKNFKEQWKAIMSKKAETEPDVPKVTKALPIIKCTEAMVDYLHCCIGVRDIALAYVIRPDTTVGAITALHAGSPHSTEHGSVEDELIARASHAHPLYREDNQLVYYKIEEGVRSTSFAASIKPFQRTKDGRSAWLALLNQFAGVDKWEAEIKKMEQLLHTRTWKGQGSYPLEKHVSAHRHAFVSMTAAAEHVTYQLPNEHSRVGYLLDSLQTGDAGLNAAMASVKTDSGDNGKRNDFEAAVTHLLPYDPVVKRRTDAKGKRGHAEISSVGTAGTADIHAFGSKKGIGKTGVHFRYHSNSDYLALNTDQQAELRAWRKTPEGQKAMKDSKRKAGIADKRPGNEKKKPKYSEEQLEATISKVMAQQNKAKMDDLDDQAKNLTVKAQLAIVEMQIAKSQKERKVLLQQGKAIGVSSTWTTPKATNAKDQEMHERSTLETILEEQKVEFDKAKAKFAKAKAERATTSATKSDKSDVVNEANEANPLKHILMKAKNA
jgi:hypothetical protein